MHELLHHVDFFERLVHLEGVDVDLLECVGAVLAIADEVDAAEAALANDVHRFVLLHISNITMEASHVALLRRLVLQPQEGEDVPLGKADGNWLVPDHSLLHLRGCALVGELQAQLHRMQSQHAVEGAVAGEVQNSEGVFLDRVVFYVDPVVGIVLELAHAHVGHRGAGFAGLGVGQVVGQETQGF